MLSQRDKENLDNFITGHYGEDQFESELSEQEISLQDEIDNLIHDLCCKLAGLTEETEADKYENDSVTPKDLQWDIHAISKIRDVALSTLKECYNITLIYP
jgi:hypothetical protein